MLKIVIKQGFLLVFLLPHSSIPVFHMFSRYSIGLLTLLKFFFSQPVHRWVFSIVQDIVSMWHNIYFYMRTKIIFIDLTVMFHSYFALKFHFHLLSISVKNSFRLRCSPLKIFLIPTSVLGFVKIYLSKRQRIVGSLVVSSRAGEIIHELILAIKNKENISKIANLMHIYPTYSMLVQQAAIKKTEESLLEGFVGKIIRFVTKLNLFF